MSSAGTLDLHVDSSGDLYALLFMVSDENFSWYLDENIRTYVTNPASGLKEDEDFIESNKMHGEWLHPCKRSDTHLHTHTNTFNLWIAGINGFLYGNLPGLSMCQGNKIHWHMIGLGNEVNIVFCPHYYHYYYNNNNNCILVLSVSYMSL